MKSEPFGPSYIRDMFSSLINPRSYPLYVCFLRGVSDGLGKLRVNQMIRTNARAKGEGLDPVKQPQ